MVETKSTGLLAPPAESFYLAIEPLFLNNNATFIFPEKTTLTRRKESHILPPHLNGRVFVKQHLSTSSGCQELFVSEL